MQGDRRPGRPRGFKPSISYQKIRPQTASTVVAELFEILRLNNVHIQEAADALGLSRIALHYWKSGRSAPSIMSVEDFADALGYDLVLRKREE